MFWYVFSLPLQKFHRHVQVVQMSINMFWVSFITNCFNFKLSEYPFVLWYNKSKVDHSTFWDVLSQCYKYLEPYLWNYICNIRGCIQKFPDWVITKYTFTTINTCWEATQRVMAAKLTRLTHKIVIHLHLVAESCTICSSCSRQPVWKLGYTLTPDPHCLVHKRNCSLLHTWVLRVITTKQSICACVCTRTYVYVCVCYIYLLSNADMTSKIHFTITKIYIPE
jgi:hypothetical protein